MRHLDLFLTILCLLGLTNSENVTSVPKEISTTITAEIPEELSAKKPLSESRESKMSEPRYYQGSSGYGNVHESSKDKRPSYNDGYKPSGGYKPTYQTSSVSYNPYRPKPGSLQSYGKPNYPTQHPSGHSYGKPNYQTQQPSGHTYGKPNYQTQQPNVKPNYQTQQQSGKPNYHTQQQSGYPPATNDGGGWQSQNTNQNSFNKYWPQQSSSNHQQIDNLNECGSQQACNAIFLRMNFTHRLCRCPGGKGKDGPCSESRDSYDGYTMELATRPIKRKTPMTLLKTCQPLSTLRPCRNPKDWSLLALQNTRTGKAQYLVTCRCPNWASLEGPVAHENPAYADIPGIRVFGMLCWSGSRGSRFQAKDPAPAFPWETAIEFAKSGNM